jgi:hypothetical protein
VFQPTSTLNCWERESRSPSTHCAGLRQRHSQSRWERRFVRRRGCGRPPPGNENSCRQRPSAAGSRSVETPASTDNRLLLAWRTSRDHAAPSIPGWRRRQSPRFLSQTRWLPMPSRGVDRSRGKWGGPWHGLGAVVAWFARFRTIVIDTARYRYESLRIGRETARLFYEIGRFLHAFIRYGGGTLAALPF